MALLALAVSPAAAYRCDNSGFEKTLRACGAEGERAGSYACTKRIAGVYKGCQDRMKRDDKQQAETAAERFKTVRFLMDEHKRAVREGRTEPAPESESVDKAKTGDQTPGGQAPDLGSSEDAASDPVESARQAFAAGDAQKALKILERALESNPGDVEALELRAQVNMAAGDKAAAVTDARRILQLDPGDEFSRVLLGQAEALALSEQKLKRIPTVDFGSKDDDGSGTLSGAGRSGGRRDEEDAVVMSGSGDGAPVAGATGLQVWQLANRHFSLGDWTSALFHATRYIKLAPDDPRGWLMRARISNRLKNWAAAEADARKALELAPDDPAALLELGYALLQQGRAAEALAHIQRALNLDGKNGLGHLYLAQTFEALGRKAEAIEAYRAAARLDGALRPLVEAALARLGVNDGVPIPAAPPPWRAPLRLFTFVVAAAFLLKGLQVVLGARRRATTGPALLPPDPEEAVSNGTPVPGTVLGGQFRIERELARGGMGVVFEATDTVLNRPVAIKRLNRTAGESPDVRRKFLQEAQLAARLKHPNLAQIFSVFGDGELYLVFELVEGVGLDGVLAQRGSLGLDEVRGLMRQACSALSHAHLNRVIHRDLKPANMMVARDGTLKLMDFGIAHEAHTVSNATMTQAWGTPPYMAPEQEDGYVLPASDLYALAVTAYELLAGQRPFDGPGLATQKRAKRFSPLGGLRGLPRSLDTFFSRALDPDPAQRFATAAEFTAAFDALAETPTRS